MHQSHPHAHRFSLAVSWILSPRSPAFCMARIDARRRFSQTVYDLQLFEVIRMFLRSFANGIALYGDDVICRARWRFQRALPISPVVLIHYALQMDAALLQHAHMVTGVHHESCIRRKKLHLPRKSILECHAGHCVHASFTQTNRHTANDAEVTESRDQRKYRDRALIET